MNCELDSKRGHANFMSDLQRSIQTLSTERSQSPSSQSGPASNMVETIIGDVSTTSETGACNLCELVKNLTEDHVPPKSCQIDEYNKKHWIHYAFVPSATPLYSQGKIKFKTLCADCNSTLGREVDDEFKNLILFLRKCRNKKCNREWANLNTRKIAVSVLAHLQAQMIAFDPSNKSKFSSYVVALFKDLGASSLKDYKIYYSVDQNPDGYTVINEAVVSYMEKGKQKSAAFSCLKMPEICFYVTKENSFMGLPRLPIKERQLFEFKRMANKQRDKAVSSPNFPEDCSELNVMLFLGSNGMRSTVARKSNKATPGPLESTYPEVRALGEKIGFKFLIWPN